MDIDKIMAYKYVYIYMYINLRDCINSDEKSR